MKMVSLPAGKQTSIQRPAVNVPSNVNICDALPRLPSQSEIVALESCTTKDITCTGMYVLM